MAKLPAFAKAFAGRWRIVEMDVWDKDFLDLVETAHLTFKGAADGEIAFGAETENSHGALCRNRCVIGTLERVRCGRSQGKIIEGDEGRE